MRRRTHKKKQIPRRAKGADAPRDDTEDIKRREDRGSALGYIVSPLTGLSTPTSGRMIGLQKFKWRH